MCGLEMFFIYGVVMFSFGIFSSIILNPNIYQYLLSFMLIMLTVYLKSYRTMKNLSVESQKIVSILTKLILVVFYGFIAFKVYNSQNVSNILKVIFYFNFIMILYLTLRYI